MTVGRMLAGAVAVLAAVAPATGCGGSSTPDPGPDGDAGLSGELVVFAAASLTDAFQRIGGRFEAAHPGLTLTFNFAGSATLAHQVNEGAPADVFASADPETMRTVTDAGNGQGSPTVFARNQLVIAVPPGNPAGISTLADLADPGVTVALCAERVPCGAAARTALGTGGVSLTPVTLERDARATLSKVTLGEVDAALVYRTDAAASAEVEAIEFPESAGAVNDYPVTVLADAGNRPAADAFVGYVLSEPGRRALVDAGFRSP